MVQSAFRDRWNTLQSLSSDDILGVLGLERKRSPLEAAFGPSLAVFAAGAFIGATAALLLAPKAGPQLRRELSEGARDWSQRIGTTASGVVQDVREALPTFGDNDKPRPAVPAETSPNHRRA